MPIRPPVIPIHETQGLCEPCHTLSPIWVPRNPFTRRACPQARLPALRCGCGADGDRGIGRGAGRWARDDGQWSRAGSVEFFEARVRPILAEQCVNCHGPKKQSSGLRLDSREAVLKGGDSGPAVVPRRPEESLLIQAVAHRHDELKMPPKGKLPDAEVALLRQWVALGAPWPAERARHAVTARVVGCRRRAALGVPAGADRPAPPPVKNRALGPLADRRLHPGPAGSRGDRPVAAGRQAHADPPRHDRPLGHPADGRGGRRVRGRPVARRLRPAGRPPAGLAALWRALGPALARRRPLRRHQGLCLHPGTPVSLCVSPIATT